MSILREKNPDSHFSKNHAALMVVLFDLLVALQGQLKDHQNHYSLSSGDLKHLK